MTTEEELEKALREAGLEDAGRGVVFPWGLKIAELDGRKVLRPLSPEEYRQAVKKATGRDLSDAEVREPKCVMANNACVSQSCTGAAGKCIASYDNATGHWVCICQF